MSVGDLGPPVDGQGANRNGHGPVEERSRAGFVSRSVADVVDMVIVCLATLIAVVAASMLRALFVGSAFELPHVRSLVGVSSLWIVFFAYLTFFWAVTGRTPGKQVSGLRVVTSRGRRLGLGRAAARALLCVVFPIGFLWVVLSSRNRAFHDVVVGTAVVYDWHGGEPVGLPPERTTAPADRSRLGG